MLDAPFSTGDQKSHIRNDIEDQEKDFKQPDDRENDDGVGFPGNGEPFVVYAIDEITHEQEEQSPQNQDTAIYYRAPHEEGCKSLNIHNFLLFLYYTYCIGH